MKNDRARINSVPGDQLATILGVSARSVTAFVAEGMPVHGRGKAGRRSRYDVGSCVRWYVERERAQLIGAGDDVSPQKARALLDIKRREALELQLAVKRGDLVSSDLVAREFADCASHVKDRLRRVPSAVADQVLTCNGPAAAQALLLGAIDEALRDLAAKAETLGPSVQEGTRGC